MYTNTKPNVAATKTNNVDRVVPLATFISCCNDPFAASARSKFALVVVLSLSRLCKSLFSNVCTDLAFCLSRAAMCTSSSLYWSCKLWWWLSSASTIGSAAL